MKTSKISAIVQTMVCTNIDSDDTKLRLKLGDRCFLLEYMQAINFGRQQGHTTAIADLISIGFLTEDDLVVAHNLKSAEMLRAGGSGNTKVIALSELASFIRKNESRHFDNIIFDSVPETMIKDILKSIEVSNPDDLKRIDGLIRVGV